jgi:hypothetical protein
MNYLKYIELSAENLQFFLWHRDYVKRFNDLPAKEQALASEWTVEQSNADAQTPGRSKKISSDAAAILKGTDFAGRPKVSEGEKVNPFYTPPRTPSGQGERSSFGESNYESTVSDGKTDHAQRAAEAFKDVNLKWKPCK